MKNLQLVLVLSIFTTYANFTTGHKASPRTPVSSGFLGQSPHDVQPTPIERFYIALHKDRQPNKNKLPKNSCCDDILLPTLMVLSGLVATYISANCFLQKS